MSYPPKSLKLHPFVVSEFCYHPPFFYHPFVSIFLPAVAQGNAGKTNVQGAKRAMGKWDSLGWPQNCCWVLSYLPSGLSGNWFKGLNASIERAPYPRDMWVLNSREYLVMQPRMVFSWIQTGFDFSISMILRKHVQSVGPRRPTTAPKWPMMEKSKLPEGSRIKR